MFVGLISEGYSKDLPTLPKVFLNHSMKIKQLRKGQVEPEEKKAKVPAPEGQGLANLLILNKSL